MTVLYSSPIFGPVHSRRLGLSLGINLMPADGKRCTFDCVYCECGLNGDFPTQSPRPTRGEVARQLEAVLRRMEAEGRLPDVLTFAGNGEPTAHPDFPAIVDDVVALRDRLAPQAKVSVLSNATRCQRPDVREALLKVDNNIQKLDTVSADYIRRVNRPGAAYDVERVVDALMAFRGHVIVQTMFMQGEADGFDTDNTGEEYVAPWLEALRKIAPQGVMIYTVARETPLPGLQKAAPATLEAIAARVRELGLPCSVSY